MSDRACNAVFLGMVPYRAAFALQKREIERIGKGGDESFLLLEHPHVITVGRNARVDAIVADHRLIAARGVDVVETDRGGDVTYHGPGQLVGYPLLALEPGRRDIRRYVHDLEETLIRTLAEYGIAGRRHQEHRGVWVGEAKIASIGVRISRWITCHGFALNVDTDLSYFSLMNPCGIPGCRMTSITAECGQTVTSAGVTEPLLRHFQDVFGRVVTRADASAGEKEGAHVS